MAKYLIIGKDIDDEIIEARDDETAEFYVEENYASDDGEMTLYRLTPITSWP